MFQNLLRLCPIAAIVLLVSMAGCQGNSAAPAQEGNAQAEAAGKQDSPAASDADFGATLASIETLKGEICKAFGDDVPEDAHDALHSVGHSLERLSEFAPNEKQISSDELVSVKASIESLFDGFGKLDDTLHSDSTVDVQELEKELTEALTKIKETMQ